MKSRVHVILNRIDFLIALALCSIFFTYGIDGVLFYIHWVAGCIVICGFFIYVLVIKPKATDQVSDITNRNVKHFYLPWILLTVWIYYAVVFTPVYYDPIMHIKYVVLTLFYTSVFLIVAAILLSSMEKMLSILFWVNVIWVLINLIMLFLFFTGMIDYRNFSGFFHNRNDFAINTTILSSSLLFFRNRFEIGVRKIIYVVLTLSFFLILSSLSLKGIFGFLLLLGMSLLRGLEAKQKKKIFIIAAIIILATALTDNPIKDRIERFAMVITAPEKLKDSESAFRRTWYLQQSFQIAKDNPIVGIGLNNSVYYLIDPERQSLIEKGEVDRGTYSHSNYSEMLLNAGFIGFLLYYLPIFLVLYKLLRKKRRHLAYYLLGLAIYKLVIDVAQVSYFNVPMVFVHSMVIYGFTQKLNK